MRPLAIFLAVAFGFSWSLAAVLFALGPGVHAGVRGGLMVAYMFGPAMGALAAQRAAGEGVLGPLGVVLRPNRWWFVAWLLPFALQPLVIGFALLQPGVEWSPEMEGFFERLAAIMPKEQMEEARTQIKSMPPAAYWALLFAQPLIAGISVNALAAFGEELGWRGWLFRRLGALGFWRRSAAVGLLWGVWHAPLILQGHNYPEHPVAGVFVMTVFCVLLAPLHDLVRARGGSVWAPAILHGTINATGAFGIMFIRGGSDLRVGVTGLAGLLALVVANAALFAADRARGGALTRP